MLMETERRNDEHVTAGLDVLREGSDQFPWPLAMLESRECRHQVELLFQIPCAFGGNHHVHVFTCGDVRADVGFAERPERAAGGLTVNAH